MFGWTELIYNHITARVPGPERHFLINRFGLLYGEITASNLVKIDLEGNVVDGSNAPVNAPGFTIHSAIHAAREDAHYIVHTHTTEGVTSPARSTDCRRIISTVPNCTAKLPTTISRASRSILASVSGW
jgi:ribulose-5-phosphate 4-epimerase/fuculose-1-phosphate aldolase